MEIIVIHLRPESCNLVKPLAWVFPTFKCDKQFSELAERLVE